ncbi:MAG: hypothetical protein WC554_14305 [Clostridia bacterium]
MKKIICILLALSMMLTLCACEEKSYEIVTGLYETEEIMSRIRFYEDGTFTFFNLLSSRIITGNYQVTDNKLTLTEYDGTNYVFTVKSDRIVFLSTTAKHSYLEKGLTYYPEKTDYENMQAAVYYGFSSYALFTDNDEVVKELYDGYYNMKTELTEEELDFTSAFYVVVGDVSFFMDKNGCIKLNDADYTVRDTADSISYDRLKQIYNDPSLMMGED